MTRRDSPDLRFDQAARPRLVGPPTASGVARMPFRCPESGLASLSRSRAPHANRLWPRPSRPRPGRRSAGRRPQLLSPGARVPVLSAAGGETVPSQRLDESAFTVSGPKAQRGTGSPDGGEQSEPGRSHGEPDSGTPSCAPPRTGRRCAACGSPATPRRKDRTSGEWVDKPNYFDITLWGALRPTAAPRSCRRGGASRSTAPRVARVGGAGRLAQAVGDLDRRRARSVPGDQGRRRARCRTTPERDVLAPRQSATSKPRSVGGSRTASPACCHGSDRTPTAAAPIATPHSSCGSAPGCAHSTCATSTAGWSRSRRTAFATPSPPG
jgi:hypothetical protein